MISLRSLFTPNQPLTLLNSLPIRHYSYLLFHIISHRNITTISQPGGKLVHYPLIMHILSTTTSIYRIQLIFFLLTLYIYNITTLIYVIMHDGVNKPPSFTPVILYYVITLYLCIYIIMENKKIKK